MKNGFYNLVKLHDFFIFFRGYVFGETDNLSEKLNISRYLVAPEKGRCSLIDDLLFSLLRLAIVNVFGMYASPRGIPKFYIA